MALIMANSGHQIVAEALYNEQFVMTWGTLPSDYAEKWEVEDVPPNYSIRPMSSTVTKTASNAETILSVLSGEVFSVTSVTSVDEVVTYTENTDYTLDLTGSNPVITWLGVNDPDLGDDWKLNYQHQENISNEVGVVLPVGYRLVTQKAYVTPDVNGVIEANGSKWSVSAEPTSHIHLQFRFSGDDASGSTIYQIAIYMNLTPATGFETNQFFLPSQVEDEGSLFMISNVSPFTRNSATREIYDIVLSM